MNRRSISVASATTAATLLLAPFGLLGATAASAAPLYAGVLVHQDDMGVEGGSGTSGSGTHTSGGTSSGSGSGSGTQTKTPSPEPTHSEDSDDDDDDNDDGLTEAQKQAAEAAIEAAKKAEEAAKQAAKDAAEAQKLADEAAKKAADQQTAESQALAEKAATAAKTAAANAAVAKQAAVSAAKKRHDLVGHNKRLELKNKYGQVQDISTPPLLIKPKSSSSANGANSATGNPDDIDTEDGFVSSPLDVSKHQLNSTGLALSDGSHDVTFSTDANEPVINNIVATDYSTPAEECMAKAYFAMGILGVGALVMTGGLLRPKRKKD